MHRVLCAFLFGVLMLVVGQSVNAQPVATVNESDQPLATEEVAARRAPAMAVAGDLPEGVRLTGLTVDTPATLAPMVTSPDGDRRATFDMIAQSLILRTTQTTSTRPGRVSGRTTYMDCRRPCRCGCACHRLLAQASV
jgi:hypothetical protein